MHYCALFVLFDLCRSKSVAPRGVDDFPPGQSDCANGAGGGVVDPYQLINTPLISASTPTSVEIVSLILLGCFFTVSIFLAASTFYYRKKVGLLLNKKRGRLQEIYLAHFK